MFATRANLFKILLRASMTVMTAAQSPVSKLLIVPKSKSHLWD